MIEKERKYLFAGDLEMLKDLAYKNIEQGYFMIKDGFEGRVRIIDGRRALITTKTDTEKLDERIELEEPISVELARSILNNCKKVLRKTRYYYTEFTTIDVFEDCRLCLVEIEGELPEVLPPFAGFEVTEIPAFKNKNLA